MSNNDVSACSLMTDYLDSIGTGKILVDRGPLSFDWTPPNLVGRDKELGLLASMFMGIGKRGSEWSRSGHRSCWDRKNCTD